MAVTIVACIVVLIALGKEKDHGRGTVCVLWEDEGS